MDGRMTERDVILAKREGYVEAKMSSYGRCSDPDCDVCKTEEAIHKAEVRKLYPLPRIRREVPYKGFIFRGNGDNLEYRPRYYGSQWEEYLSPGTVKAILDAMNNQTEPDPEDVDE